MDPVKIANLLDSTIKTDGIITAQELQQGIETTLESGIINQAKKIGLNISYTPNDIQIMISSIRQDLALPAAGNISTREFAHGIRLFLLKDDIPFSSKVGTTTMLLGLLKNN